jgi:hypothetical protein
MFVASSCNSWTGKYLYSDSIVQMNCECGLTNPYDDTGVSSLNKLVRTPIVGRLAGISRIALAIIHIIGHTLAGIITQNRDHFIHVAKGCLELVRAAIESTPILGLIFSIKYDGHFEFFPSHGSRSVYFDDFHTCNSEEHVRFWIMKIYHPKHLENDRIIQVYLQKDRLSKIDLEAGRTINLFTS